MRRDHQGPPFKFNNPTADDKLPKVISDLGQFARRCCILQHPPSHIGVIYRSQSARVSASGTSAADLP